MSASPLYVGLDAGGTKTELCARTAWEGPSHSRFGPAANLQRLGLAGTARVLADLVREALTEHPGATLQAVCAGVAGAGDAADQEPLADALRAELAPHTPTVRVVHDGEIAVEAAFEGGSGLIIVTGTGSVAYARARSGQFCRVGGWGYLIGDEGSGHVLGLHGLRAVAAAYDGGPQTLLRSLLAERHGLGSRPAIIHAVYQESWPVQRMAPLVVEAAALDDAVARQIIDEQTHLLVRQVTWLVEQCDAAEPRIALMGGLSKAKPYRKALIAALSEQLPGWRFEEPAHPPVVGALRLALQAAENSR